MQAKLPESRWQRSLVTGKTAVSVGGKVLNYLAKKPFLTETEQQIEKKRLGSASAKTIFQGLVLLKGTALKIAQALSLESGLIPDDIRAELEKSYNQVPPMNRVLVKKAVSAAFHEPMLSLFSDFNLAAFAAASLGQVHLAKDHDGNEIAVKVQYPGISKTIKSDIQMIKGLLRPLPDFHLILPTINEIETRLNEEIDYTLEARNIKLFKTLFESDTVMIPDVFEDLSTQTVLSTRYIEGETIDQWLKTNPSQQDRDSIANTLYSIFINGFYDHQVIHADPNPGNYIVTPDAKTGLVDFGCIKQFSPEFVANHRELIHMAIHQKTDEYIPVLTKMSILSPSLTDSEKEKVTPIITRIIDWYRTLYNETVFDFSNSTPFLNQGKELMQELFHQKNKFSPNAEFVFLDRTRYGLFRLFETMGARVTMINEHEC